MNKKAYFEFLTEMTMRDFKARYKKAVFGVLWTIINPLLEMAIIGTIFSLFIKIPNYYLFLFSGLLPWRFFASAISKATPSFDHQRYLLKKAVFPKETIPLSIILSSFLSLLISVGLFIVYLIVTGNYQHLNILLLSIGLIWLLGITIGLSLITAPINARYRDINLLIQTALVLIFYATPILYSSNQLSERLINLIKINPLSTPIEMIRSSLIGDPANYQVATPNFLVTLAIILLGVFTYRKMHKYMVDWL